MNKQFKYIASAMLVAASGSAFTSCNDWTEPESIDVTYPAIEDSANYPAYLANLREYRKSDHSKVYAWVTLKEDAPSNECERMTSLPDSIDVLVLADMNIAHPLVAADLKKVREEKGMEVIYNIDFDAIKTAYTVLCEQNAADRTAVNADLSQLEEDYNANENKDDETVKAEYEAAKAELEAKLAALADPDFNDYVLENLTEQLNYVASQNLDGVMFAFNGKAETHMTEAEKSEYRAQQLVFLGVATDWHKRNPELVFDFLGYPQNISDKTIFNDFRMLFVRQGLDATNGNLYAYYMTLAMVDGVPVEKLGMMATYKSSDPEDTKTGYYSDGTLALVGFAKWAAAAQPAGVGIKNAQMDYFNPGFSYPHVRAIIQAVNPSIK